MALDMAKLRQKLEQKQNSNYQGGNQPQIFSFSKLKPGDEVSIRFVEDGDPDNNSTFWRERHTRSLYFKSIKLANGDIVNNSVYVTVPAFNLKRNEVGIDDLPEEYLFKSDEDVIQECIKPLYIPGDDVSMKQYSQNKKKVTYVFQGFVRAPGYETKLYRFIINTDLFNIITKQMRRFKELPTHKELGVDFILSVSEKSINLNGVPKKVKDYESSSWDLNSSPLTAQELTYLEENKSFVLKDYIPKKPTTEQLQVMLEMYQASANEEPYDVVKWSKVYRPDNIQIDANGMIKNIQQSNTTNATDIPAQPVTQTVVQQVVQQAPQTVVQQVSQPVASSVSTTVSIGVDSAKQPQMLVDSPVQTKTAPQIASEVTENIQATNPTDSVNAIMARLMGSNVG